MVLSAHYTLPDYEKQSLAKASQVRGKPQGSRMALLITEAPVPVLLGFFSATTFLLQRNSSEADVKQPINCLI